MPVGWRTAAYVCALIAVLGLAISFYTEYVVKVKPCFSCLILRYSNLIVALLSIASLRARRLMLAVGLLSVLIIVISAWGVLGYVGYIENPCIEACPLEEDLEIGYRLFSLALVGGIVEAALSVVALRPTQEG